MSLSWSPISGRLAAVTSAEAGILPCLCTYCFSLQCYPCLFNPVQASCYFLRTFTASYPSSIPFFFSCTPSILLGLPIAMLCPLTPHVFCLSGVWQVYAGHVVTRVVCNSRSGKAELKKKKSGHFSWVLISRICFISSSAAQGKRGHARWLAFQQEYFRS